MAWNISKAKRQALVKLQLRDKNGKFIEMGGGVKWYSSRLRKVVSGTVVGTKGENALIRLNRENDTHEPALVSVPARSIEPISAKATLPGKGVDRSNADTPEFEKPDQVSDSKGDDQEIDNDTESDHERSVEETDAQAMSKMETGTVLRNAFSDSAHFIKLDGDNWEHHLSNGSKSGIVGSSVSVKNHDSFQGHTFAKPGTDPMITLRDDESKPMAKGAESPATPATDKSNDESPVQEDSAENYAITETSDGNTYISKKDGQELYSPARDLQVGDEVLAPDGADPTKPFSIGRNWATKGAERLNSDGPVIGKVIAMEGDRYAVVQMADGHTIPDRRNPDETTDTVTIGLSNKVIKATPGLKEALGDKLGEGNYGDRPSDEDQEITDNDPQAQSDHVGREATPEQIAEEEAAPEAVDPATAKPVLTHRITGAAKDELEFGIETMESDGVDPGLRMSGSKAEVYDVDAAIFTVDGPLGVLDDNLMGDVYKGSHKAIAKAKQRGLKRFMDVLKGNKKGSGKTALEAPAEEKKISDVSIEEMSKMPTGTVLRDPEGKLAYFTKAEGDKWSHHRSNGDASGTESTSATVKASGTFDNHTFAKPGTDPNAENNARQQEAPEAVAAPESAPEIAPAPEATPAPEAPVEGDPEAPEEEPEEVAPEVATPPMPERQPQSARQPRASTPAQIKEAVSEIEQDTEDIDSSGITGEDLDAALEEAVRDITGSNGEGYTIVPIRDSENQWNYGLADENGTEVANFPVSEYDSTAEIASEIIDTVNSKADKPAAEKAPKPAEATEAKKEAPKPKEPEAKPAETSPAPAEKEEKAPVSVPKPEVAPESAPEAEAPVEELAPPLDVDVTPNRAMPGSIRVQSNKNKKILSGVASLRTGDRVFPIGTPDKPYGTHSNYSGKSGFVHTNYKAGVGTVVSQHGGFAKVLGEDGQHYYPTHHFVALKATPELEAEVAAVNERHIAESNPSVSSTPEASAPKTGFLNGYDIDADSGLGRVQKNVEGNDYVLENTTGDLVSALPVGSTLTTLDDTKMDAFQPHVKIDNNLWAREKALGDRGFDTFTDSQMMEYGVEQGVKLPNNPDIEFTPADVARAKESVSSSIAADESYRQGLVDRAERNATPATPSATPEATPQEPLVDGTQDELKIPGVRKQLKRDDKSKQHAKALDKLEAGDKVSHTNARGEKSTYLKHADGTWDEIDPNDEFPEDSPIREAIPASEIADIHKRGDLKVTKEGEEEEADASSDTPAPATAPEPAATPETTPEAAPEPDAAPEVAEEAPSEVLYSRILAPDLRREAGNAASAEDSGFTVTNGNLEVTDLEKARDAFRKIADDFSTPSANRAANISRNRVMREARSMLVRMNEAIADRDSTEFAKPVREDQKFDGSGLKANQKSSESNSDDAETPTIEPGKRVKITSQSNADRYFVVGHDADKAYLVRTNNGQNDRSIPIGELDAQHAMISVDDSELEVVPHVGRTRLKDSWVSEFNKYLETKGASSAPKKQTDKTPEAGQEPSDVQAPEFDDAPEEQEKVDPISDEQAGRVLETLTSDNPLPEGIERHVPEAVEGEDYAPTQQQQDVIDAVLGGLNTVVQAKAGAGKTSTLRAIARRLKLGRPDAKIGYIAFNKAVQLEANATMPDNTEARTGHSVAVAWAPDWMNARTKGTNGIIGRPSEVAAHLGISESLNANGKAFGVNAQAMAVKRTLDSFANSAADNVTPDHLPDSVKAMSESVQTKVLDFAAAAWLDMASPKGKLKMSLDHIRKNWALSRPDFSKEGSGLQKPVSVLFLDEAQDTPPVLARVIADQTIQKVIVGDADQAIYAFTGATDYLSDANGDVELPLNKSWRFGPQVADMGNRFLQILESDQRVIGGGQSNIVTGMTNADAVLVRSNGGMFDEIMKEIANDRTVAVPKDTKKDLTKLIQTARYIKGEGGAPENGLHDDLANFHTWEEFLEEAERGDDTNLAKIARMVATFGLPKMEEILSNVTEIGDGSMSGVRFEDHRGGLMATGETFPAMAFLREAGFKYIPAKDGRIAATGSNRGNIEKLWTALGTPAAREQKLAKARELAAAAAPKPDVTVSTAHKAKGLEWGRVRIGDDFWAPKRDEVTGEVTMVSPEELRLNYVAVTRAEKELDLGSLAWVMDHSDENGGELRAPASEEDSVPSLQSEDEAVDKKSPVKQSHDEVAPEEAPKVESTEDAPEKAPEAVKEPEVEATPEEEAPSPYNEIGLTETEQATLDYAQGRRERAGDTANVDDLEREINNILEHGERRNAGETLPEYDPEEIADDAVEAPEEAPEVFAEPVPTYRRTRTDYSGVILSDSAGNDLTAGDTIGHRTLGNVVITAMTPASGRVTFVHPQTGLDATVFANRTIRIDSNAPFEFPTDPGTIYADPTTGKMAFIDSAGNRVIAGDRIVDRNGKAGTVKTVYPGADGKASVPVKWDNGTEGRVKWTKLTKEGAVTTPVDTTPEAPVAAPEPVSTPDVAPEPVQEELSDPIASTDREARRNYLADLPVGSRVMHDSGATYTKLSDNVWDDPATGSEWTDDQMSHTTDNAIGSWQTLPAMPVADGSVAIPASVGGATRTLDFAEIGSQIVNPQGAKLTKVSQNIWRHDDAGIEFQTNFLAQLAAGGGWSSLPIPEPVAPDAYALNSAVPHSYAERKRLTNNAPVGTVISKLGDDNNMWTKVGDDVWMNLAGDRRSNVDLAIKTSDSVTQWKVNPSAASAPVRESLPESRQERVNKLDSYPDGTVVSGETSWGTPVGSYTRLPGGKWTDTETLQHEWNTNEIAGIADPYLGDQWTATRPATSEAPVAAPSGLPALPTDLVDRSAFIVSSPIGARLRSPSREIYTKTGDDTWTGSSGDINDVWTNARISMLAGNGWSAVDPNEVIPVALANSLPFARMERRNVLSRAEIGSILKSDDGRSFVASSENEWDDLNGSNRSFNYYDLMMFTNTGNWTLDKPEPMDFSEGEISSDRVTRTRQIHALAVGSSIKSGNQTYIRTDKNSWDNLGNDDEVHTDSELRDVLGVNARYGAPDHGVATPPVPEVVYPAGAFHPNLPRGTFVPSAPGSTTGLRKYRANQWEVMSDGKPTGRFADDAAAKSMKDLFATDIQSAASRMEFGTDLDLGDIFGDGTSLGDWLISGNSITEDQRVRLEQGYRRFVEEVNTKLPDGIKAELYSFSASSGSMSTEVTFHKGNRNIATATRHFGTTIDARTKKRVASVDHAYWKLDDNVQGGGISNAFLKSSKQFYRQLGLDRATIHANIDVGGYAWARSGWDWKNYQKMASAFEKLERFMNSSMVAPPGREQEWVDGKKAFAALKAKATKANFRQDVHPSAFELSQLGKDPNSPGGRTATWFGKQLMLGRHSDWFGDLILSDPDVI